MSNAAKRYNSETRAKVINEAGDTAEDIRHIKQILDTIMASRVAFIASVPPAPAEEPAQPTRLEKELAAAVEHAGRYSHIAPQDASMVGRRVYVRVTGQKVLCEVVKEREGERRPYLLRRCDNGRLLPRPRSLAALHPDARPLSFPPQPRKEQV